jgi:hypothetical protein
MVGVEDATHSRASVALLAYCAQQRRGRLVHTEFGRSGEQKDVKQRRPKPECLLESTSAFSGPDMFKNKKKILEISLCH